MHDDEAEEIESFEAIVAELARLRTLNAELVGALEGLLPGLRYLVQVSPIKADMKADWNKSVDTARAILARAKESRE